MSRKPWGTVYLCVIGTQHVCVCVFQGATREGKGGQEGEGGERDERGESSRKSGEILTSNLM